MAVLICLMWLCTSGAGNVKVLGTEYLDVTYDMESNLFVQMKVRVLMSNIAQKECGVMMVLDNQAWANKLTYDEFLKLINSRCYGDAYLPAIGATPARRAIKVTVPLDPKKLTGESDTFYAKAYIYNLKSDSCTGEGEMIEFEIDFDEIKKRMMNDATNIVGGALLLAPFFW